MLSVYQDILLPYSSSDIGIINKTAFLVMPSYSWLFPILWKQISLSKWAEAI